MLTPEPQAEEGTEEGPCHRVKVWPQPFPRFCWLMEGIQRATASRHHPGSCSTLQAPTHLLALVPIEATGTFCAPVTLQGWEIRAMPSQH